MTFTSKSEPDVLRIRDLPDLPRIERRLRLYETGGDLSAESESILTEFCRANFGIGLDVEFPWPPNFDKLPIEEKWAIEDLAEEFEDTFETSGVSAEDGKDILLKYKVDFSDESGWPLLCTRYLMRPVEAAAKGILGGKLPKAADVQIENWGASLQRDAAIFKPNKARN